MKKMDDAGYKMSIELYVSLVFLVSRVSLVIKLKKQNKPEKRFFACINKLLRVYGFTG
jgi:hypothetical protein